MHRRFHSIRLLACCSLLSILAHLLLISSLGRLGNLDLGAAVNLPFGVMVDLATAAATGNAGSREFPAPEHHGARAPAPEAPLSEDETDYRFAQAGPEPPAVEPEPEAQRAQPEPGAVRIDPARVPAARTETDGVAGPRAEADPAPAEKAQHSAIAKRAPAMLTTVSEFLAAKDEKLTYLISMHGMPIGSAELESGNANGVTSITLRVKSNAALSGFFPVDNVIETRHVDGRFIMTNIRQQEGSFKRDESFTINLRKKRVSRVDLSTPGSSTLTVPTDDLLDTLSGIYYLRNRQLQVGRTETLHIYDSETYAEVPVEILRREELRLPDLSMVDTLVLRPLQQTAGIFRRTGDILIWMTDDDFKVPVRIATSIALGKVTADLVSAESKSHAEEGSDTSR